MKVDAKHLSDACDALGKIMDALGARKFLNRNDLPARMVKSFQERALSDAQIDSIAIEAFEAAAMELAKIGYPGATMFSCNPTEEPS